MEETLRTSIVPVTTEDPFGSEIVTLFPKQIYVTITRRLLPLFRKDGDIVYAISNDGVTCVRQLTEKLSCR